MKTPQSQLAFNHLVYEKMTTALTHLWTPARGAGLKITALLLEPVKRTVVCQNVRGLGIFQEICLSGFSIFSRRFPKLHLPG